MLICRYQPAGRSNIVEHLDWIKANTAHLADPVVLELEEGQVSLKFKWRWHTFLRTAWCYLTRHEDFLPAGALEPALSEPDRSSPLESTLPWLWAALNAHWDIHGREQTVRMRNLRDWVLATNPPDLESMTLAEAMIVADQWCFPRLKRLALAHAEWD